MESINIDQRESTCLCRRVFTVAGSGDSSNHVFRSYRPLSAENFNFATQVLHEQVTSDNGSNLVSKKMEDFFSCHGIRHRKITPYWPKANAKVERFKWTVEKGITTAHVEGEDMKETPNTSCRNSVNQKRMQF